MVLALVESYSDHLDGRHLHGVRRNALDQGLRGQHRAIHRIGRRKAIRASASGEHRRQSNPDLGSYIQRHDRCLPLHPCRLLNRHARACQSIARDDAAHRQWLQHGERFRPGGCSGSVGGATTAFAAGLAGGGAMAGNALRLASAQLDQKDDARVTHRRSRIGRAAALTGYTAKNMVACAARRCRAPAERQPGARHGLATWRMSADLANRRRLIRDDLNKPKPPNDNGGNSIS